MNRKDFQELAALRLKEARILLRDNCWEGAYYLGGYVAECAFKACIAKQTARYEFPDKRRAAAVYTHNLAELAKLVGLDEGLDGAEQTYPELYANWTIVRNWWELSRYGRPSQVEAENLLRALAEPKHGVLRWLKQHC